ncbi:hypothetical protein [Candidatus Enterococcus mansonii]|uniref:MucBP domain-containing protein n=1 Tax=Candidatus Enterococcus mansonii TaxID=1834181 RepID=A0A242CCZ9_9ENTE|nr:hypothetical protein [Enterococcus sp. 4G2_DIV0659]OTO07998.1 hypothetical protein A5880_002268 [Enterococcus sp. 4G2_DIV0659]
MSKKKKQSTQIKRTWRFIGMFALLVALLSIWSITQKPISANNKEHTERQMKQTKPTLFPKDPSPLPKVKKHSTKALEPVENEKGLKATPKVYTLMQTNPFPDLTNPYSIYELVSDLVLPEASYEVEYEYVTEKGIPSAPDSSKLGFQTIYVKITEKKEQSSIIVPIPVTVINGMTTMLFNNEVALQTEDFGGYIAFTPEELKDKTDKELKQILKSKSKVKAWRLDDGSTVLVDVTDTTVEQFSNASTTAGHYSIEFEAILDSETGARKETTSKSAMIIGFEMQENIEFQQNTEATAPSMLVTSNYTIGSTDFQYVDKNGVALEKFDTSKVGFHWAYVKMISQDFPELTTIKKVPINIRNINTSDHFNNEVLVATNENIVFYPDELKGKKETEILQMLQSKSDLRAWDKKTGKAVSASFKSTTLQKDPGIYYGEVVVEKDDVQETITKDVKVFGGVLQEPKYFQVKQNERLEIDAYGYPFFSSVQTVSGYTKFEWVKNGQGEETEPKNTFDSSKAGFHWGYIKIMDELYEQYSTVIPIPIMVTAEPDSIVIDNSTSKVGLMFEKNQNLIFMKELEGKTVPEITQLLEEKLNIKAWELTSGKRLRTKLENTTINSESTGGGKVVVKIEAETEELNHEIEFFIFPKEIFGDEGMKGWQDIPLNSTTAIITNPFNGSQMSFPNRGLIDSVVNEDGFIIKDGVGKGYLYRDDRVLNIPGMDGAPIYNQFNIWDRGSGLNGKESISKKWFLQKGNQLKQVLYDSEHELIYVYNLSMSRNLNFFVQLETYNVSRKKRRLAMLESVDTDYYNDSVPMYSLGEGAGFYMEPEPGKRFTIRLKNSQGNWLSDYTKYYAGSLGNIYDNFFGNDFTGKGTESEGHKAGEEIVSGIDSAYQLGAPWQQIAPGEALKTGYEIFAGAELPYMEIKAKPETFNVYPDYTGEYKATYKLSKIPTEESQGKIYVTYPDKSEEIVPYTSNALKEFDGKLTIPRETLPKKLNEEPGTIQKYSTSLLGINETEGPMNGLPSKDYAVTINVYNLGGKAIPQIMQKGTKFNKKPQELIKDPVILPGHKAVFEYEGDMPDTSSTGMQYVKVRMTDTNEPDKTTIINIPILVIDETPPTQGLYLIANDFQKRPDAFQDKTESEINELILKYSEATAWDVTSGSSDDIHLSVTHTNLTTNPKEGKYSATVKAERGTETTEKTISIDIQSNQKVKVEFVDESAEKLHDPIIFDEAVGSTIDLTKEEEVQKAVTSILDKNYQIDKRPENEESIPVQSEESTVQYKFKGKLFIQSSPTFLNFGRKSLGLPFIKVEKAKYDQPLIVWDNRKGRGAWKLTATLRKPLMSLEDPSKTLPSAIRYKIDDNQTVILSENTTQPIAVRTHGKDDEYNISQEWDQNKSGLILEVPSGQVLQSGAYRATILWQLGQTP